MSVISEISDHRTINFLT